MPPDYDRRSLRILSIGHGCADACQGALPALLPFLVAGRGYSFGQVSALVLAGTISSSVVQPLFGIASDRRSLAWLMPAGLLAGGAGIAVAGVLTTYGLVFAAVVVSGLGIAAYHPEGSRYAAYASGPKRGTGMSVFSVGGNIGFAVGPIIVTPALLAIGLAGSAVLLIPAVGAAVLLAASLPRLHGLRPADGHRAATDDASPDDWGAFGRLGLAVTLRSFIYFGLVTFVPLYFIGHLSASKATGNAALAAMLAAGAVGTLIGGRLADRIGTRAVFAGSMALVGPLLVAFLLAGVAGAFAAITLIGAVTISTFSVSVVIAQDLLPRRLGLASGVTLGLSIGLGGVGAVLLGLIADAHGVRAALEWLLVLPPLTCLLALTLPRPAGSRRGRPAQPPDRIPALQPEQP